MLTFVHQVYCGDCAGEAQKSRGVKAGRGKAKASREHSFTKCIADGCGRSVITSKAMVQLYL